AARRPARVVRPWSRHDRAFTAAAIAIAALAVAGRLAGVGGFGAYPRLHGAIGAATVAFATAIVLATLLPFCDRRGIG
ncbi:MAG: cobalt transport protein, partial [Conexibacter sp.]|nr:cobalt transport protein [Conexibacter sp.]